MCGIVGFAGSAGAEREASLRAMCAAIVHRGPDEEGRYAAPDWSSSVEPWIGNVDAVAPPNGCGTGAEEHAPTPRSGRAAPEPGRSVEFVSSHPLVVHAPDDGEAAIYAGGWRWADVTISAD